MLDVLCCGSRLIELNAGVDAAALPSLEAASSAVLPGRPSVFGGKFLLGLVCLCARRDHREQLTRRFSSRNSAGYISGTNLVKSNTSTVPSESR